MRLSTESGDKAAPLAFFHRLRPLTSITKTDAQVRGGETRQDYKDTGVSPGSSLVRSPVPTLPLTGYLSAFIPSGSVALSHSSRCWYLSSVWVVRSKLGCVHEPPVQPDRCALSGNYRLESNPVRHDKAPLAAAIGN